MSSRTASSSLRSVRSALLDHGPISLPPDPASGVKLPPRATASGRHAEVAMNDELAARHRAITLRLAGRPVKSICAAVGRSECWFHKWWRRYRQSGAEGLFDLTRANHHAQRIPPELERIIL